MIKKLQIKFIAANMGIVTIMLCFILGLVYHFTRTDLENKSINMMQDIASQPFRLAVPDKAYTDMHLPYFTIRLGLKGELITSGAGYFDLSDNELLNNLKTHVFTSTSDFGIIEKYNLRYYRINTPLEKYCVFADISSEIATLDGLMKTCILTGAFSFLVFLCISILLSKWAVKPVETAWKQQKQFIADASHELKTPLTVIITNAELMSNPGYSSDKRQKFLDGILTMAHQMKELTGQILELARNDNTLSRENFCPVNFSSLVSNAILPFEPVFFEKNLILVQQIEQDIKVAGIETKLKEVTGILLDNACKYSRAAGTTRITLKKYKRNHCLLSVANEGKEILPDDLKNIFLRFYRTDKARNHKGSFGLGLSIAESIVKKHKGKIWAESKNGVNYFYVDLPCF